MLSNLALLPAILYARRLGLVPEAAILGAVLVVSSAYHLCQAGFVCILDIDFVTFQRHDHFTVYAALVWMTLYLVGISLPHRFAIFIWIQVLLFPLVTEFMSAWWASGLVVGVTVVVAVILLVLVVRGFPNFNIPAVVAAVVLVAVGFALHVAGGDPTPPGETTGADGSDLTNHPYAWLHSAWHIFVMIALYYVIDFRHGQSLIAYLFRKKSKSVDDTDVASQSRTQTKHLLPLSIRTGRSTPKNQSSKENGKKKKKTASSLRETSATTTTTTKPKTKTKSSEKKSGRHSTILTLGNVSGSYTASRTTATAAAASATGEIMFV